MANIFISSTSQDLQEHRAAVKSAIERLDQRAIDMKNFGSQPGGSVGVSLEEVAKGDVFVGIIAYRYGYVPGGQEKSVTEQEYDEAVRRKLPRLMYIINPDYKNEWPAEFIEDDDLAQERLNKFKAYINANEVRSYFTTPDNLAQQVSADLTKELQTLKQRQRMFLLGGFVAVIIAILLGAFIASSIISTGQKEAAISQADRQATNNEVAVINQTATAAQWTPTPTATVTYTPTATLTPSITPTPTATPCSSCQVAAEGEIVVVITKFIVPEGIRGEPEIDMHEILVDASQDYDNVRIIRIGDEISTREEAQELLDAYNATMVIYGRISAFGSDENLSLGVSTRYEIIPLTGQSETIFYKALVVSLEDVNNFSFLLRGQDAPYILEFTLGQLSYFQADYETAAFLFMNAVDKLDIDRAQELSGANLYFYLGNIHSYAGLTDLSLDDFNRALEIDATLGPIYNNRGNLHLLRGDIELAQQDYDEAIKYDPYQAVIYYNRGVLYDNIGEVELAIEEYNRAIELDDTYALAYNNRGWILYEEMGEVDLAFNDFNEAIKYDPNEALAYMNRASMYVVKSEADLALEDYAKAIQLNPNYARSYYNRGILYNRLGEINLAIADYTQAIELDPTAPEFYNNRGVLYLYESELDLALGDYNQAIKLNGNFALAYLNRADVYYLRDELDLAINNYTQAIELDLDLPIAAYLNRGLSYYELERYDLALEDFLEYERLGGQLVSVGEQRKIESQRRLTPTSIPNE